MKKHDTPIYKFKACAAAVILCGLFTVFAVGCSQKTESENPQHSASRDISDLEVHTRITFPELSKLEPDQSYIRTIVSAEILTMEEISLGELTIPDGETTTNPSMAVFENEKTENNPFLKETMVTPEDVFVIGEDTTATMVYGFN